MMKPMGNTMDDIPDEVLEFILGFLPPYKDIQNCMLVCKRWYHCAQNVMHNTSVRLVKAVSEFKILWKNITPPDMAPTITKRFSHAACILENSMYIFGGCTTNATAFNDLWRFDLSSRQWVRPLATGTYPVPKAYTTLVSYQDNLILFGGWTYPSPSQYYQTVTMFNEVHFYNVSANKWILIKTENNPPPMAGHSSCIKGDEMVVFGGLVKSSDIQYQIQCSSDVWVLDLKSFSWRMQPTSKPKPSPRYAQSLVSLDDHRFMLLGGTQIMHNRFVYNDCWILNMSGLQWTWKEISVKNKEWAAANIWCNPACRVGDKVVSLSRSRSGWNSAKPLVTSAVRLSGVSRREGPPVSVRVAQSLRRPLDRDQNVNGKRGFLPRHQAQNQNRLEPEFLEPVAGPSSAHDNEAVVNISNENSSLDKKESKQPSHGKDKNILKNKILPAKNNSVIIRHLQESNKYRMAAFACDPPAQGCPEQDLVNQRQLGHVVQREPQPAPEPQIQPQPKKLKRNTLTMHVLDISSVVDGNTFNHVSWLCPQLGEASNAPEELLMYSLVKGNGELIMFGGVHNDVNILDSVSFNQNLYSNSLHFITIPRDII